VTAGIDLVCFGYRPGVLHATSRLDLGVFLVEDKPPTAAARRRIAGWLTTPLEDDPETVADRTRQALGDAKPRAVVAAGERGVLAAAALRDAYGLGGVDLSTARLARDKPAMKAAARQAGVPCTDWRELDATTRAEDLVAALGLPLVLKHRAGSGTRGLVVANDPEGAARGLDSIPERERDGWMAERFVKGREMSVESFVQDGRILFVNPTEYYVIGFANIAPAVLPEAEAKAGLDLNAAALKALGIQRGMTHLELYRTARGLVFGEVAVRPPGGRLMRLIRRAYDFDPWELVVRLEAGLDVGSLPAGARRTAGVWMLHPGPGRVVSVRGLTAARRVKGVRKVVCRTRAGRVLEARQSTGSDVGWVEVHGRTRDEVVERLEAAHGAIRIEMAPPG
jgi:biotin carboxylase